MTTLDLITRADLENFKKDLFEELSKLKIDSGENVQKKWLRSGEVRKMLGISPGTLQALRVKGVLSFTKVGSILYYKHEDINRVLEENLSFTH
ncbi:helix-turn-helix domain-containing protein [Pedobacter panaciterrae]|jgi:hypothetical protein|uniref:helix-turn-helix domain-containing protein n=1 Tax=Pedobacter panaciterrae TaxID=363849 RepID=UPI00155DC973|nr:helix-turn-helix domain-containing protein [Pedobacter panaciterrae]NQX52276.1 helix-turn-helix domain-containing protein [Pedobacter panaciterrae]